MGKMMEALRKAEAMKREAIPGTSENPMPALTHHHAVEHAEERISPWQNILQATIIVVFLIIGITSIIFNFTTVTELKKTKEQAGYMSSQLQAQGQQLNQIMGLVGKLTTQNQEKSQQIITLERDIAQVRKNMDQREERMAGLLSENKIFNGRIQTLTSQNQTLTVQYKDLNDKFKKLENFIQEMHTMISNPNPAAVGGETKENSEWEN